MKKNNNFINIVLIGGSGFIAGLLNYAYHPLMLQFLSLEEFAEFASLLGIMNILGVFLVGISLFLNKEVALAGEDTSQIRAIFGESSWYLGVLGVLLFGAYALMSSLIADFLKVHTPLVILAGVGLITGCMGTGTDGVLRGMKQFRFMSMMTIAGSLLKLILGLIFVGVGLQNYGALGGIISSGLLTFFAAFFWCLMILQGSQGSVSKKGTLLGDFWKQKKEIGNFVLVSFFFAFFFNIDIIFAKHIFSEELVGIYAGISVLGKFLVFLLLSIETVYYSEIMSHPKEQVALHHIRNPLLGIVLTSLLAILVNFFIGDFLLRILKPELSGNLSLYLLLLVYYALLVCISFFSKVLVGWGVYSSNIVLGIFAFLLTLTIFIFGKESIEVFILIFIAFGSLLTLTLGLLFWKNYSKNTKKSLQ